VKSLRGGNDRIVWEGCKDFDQAELRTGKRKYGENLFIRIQKNSTNLNHSAAKCLKKG